MQPVFDSIPSFRYLRDLLALRAQQVPDAVAIVAPGHPPLIQLQQVGIDDDFFELGGYSLLVVQVLTRLNRHFCVELPLRALFEALTVANLALTITQAKAEAETHIDQLLAQVEQMQGQSGSHESSEGR